MECNKFLELSPLVVNKHLFLRLLPKKFEICLIGQGIQRLLPEPKLH